jgi:tetratricopeptide (TPR) repeat protein
MTFNEMKIRPFLTVVVLMIGYSLHAQEKTFVKEYTYKASEADSKVSCRAIAINQLRSMLLNDLGVYVESNQVLKNKELGGKFSDDFVENISTISAGITKLDILSETWNGETFWMKAAITVDTISLQESLRRISEDRRKVKELEDLKERLNDSDKKLKELTMELNSQKEANQKAAVAEKYNLQVNLVSSTNFMYTAKSRYDEKDFAGAIDGFDKVISLDPKFTLAYAYRGHAKTNLGNYTGAIDDFTKAINLYPNFDAAYVDRGNARFFSGDYNGAISDFTKAIQLNRNYAVAYANRGEAKLKLKNYTSALDDFDKTVQLDPNYGMAYFSRGIVKNHLRKKGACADWNQAGRLNCPQAYDLIAKFCK